MEDRAKKYVVKFVESVNFYTDKIWILNGTKNNQWKLKAYEVIIIYYRYFK